MQQLKPSGIASNMIRNDQQKNYRAIRHSCVEGGIKGVGNIVMVSRESKIHCNYLTNGIGVLGVKRGGRRGNERRHLQNDHPL